MRSQLVLFFAGTTANFAWEIGEVFRHKPFVRTMMMVPFFQSYSPERVDQFRALFESASGLSLPENLSAMRAVYFPARDQMMPIMESE